MMFQAWQDQQQRHRARHPVHAGAELRGGESGQREQPDLPHTAGLRPSHAWRSVLSRPCALIPYSWDWAPGTNNKQKFSMVGVQGWQRFLLDMHGVDNNIEFA